MVAHRDRVVLAEQQAQDIDVILAALRPIHQKPRPGPLAKGVVHRNRVGEAVLLVIHVNPKDLGQVRGQILSVPLRVLLRPGVAHAEVEKPVGTELDAEIGRASCRERVSSPV